MNDRLRSGSGTHSSRHLLPLALLTWASVAGGQEAPSAAPAPIAAAPIAKPTAAAAQSPAPKAPEADSKPIKPAEPIQLYLGSARDLLTQEKWDTIIAAQPTDPADEGDLPSLGDADVEVEGKRRAPNVPGGFGGLFWAMRHPTQAWRIFMPAPSE
jgi:hypothetical protein